MITGWLQDGYGMVLGWVLGGCRWFEDAYGVVTGWLQDGYGVVTRWPQGCHGVVIGWFLVVIMGWFHGL